LFDNEIGPSSSGGVMSEFVIVAGFPTNNEKDTIAQVTEFVGYKPMTVRIQNKWIVINYPTMVVRIRKW